MKHFIIFAVSVLLLSSCQSTPKKESDADLRGPASPDEAVAVWLLPLDDTNFEYAAKLARVLTADLKIRVKASLNLSSSGLEPFPVSTQYSAESIIALAKQVGGHQYDTTTNTAFIALTTKDINSNSRSLRFLFASHDKKARVSVVSLNRLNYVGTSPEAVWMRSYKLIKRSIGEIYFQYPRSADTNDIMYSPLMGVPDLDMIGSDFLAKKTKSN